MRVKYSALLTGQYDWEPEVLPVSEFEERLAATRLVLAREQADLLVVYGHAAEYGALAYLTGFVPKLGPALAIVSMRRPPQLLVSGSENMLGAAKRLTWIADVRPIGDLRTAIVNCLASQSEEEVPTVGLWSSVSMPLQHYRAVTNQIESAGRMLDLNGALNVLRRSKSPREMELVRKASEILGFATEVMLDAAGHGFGARSSVLRGECRAFDLGAQDVRTLGSARDGGPPVAFDGPSDITVSPLLIYIAVRHAGYWAEGFVTNARSRSGAVSHCGQALNAMVREARPGVTLRALSKVASSFLQPFTVHPLVARQTGGSIGSSRDESTDGEDLTLEQGGVYSLRVGAVGPANDNAILSAMIAVGSSHTETLWSANDCSCPWNVPR